jgi:hypothetical protein
MKTILKFLLLTLLVIFLFLALYLGVQSFRLRWWGTPEIGSLEELTPAQKAEDMRYLLDLTRQVSQAEAVWQAAGLDNPLDQPELWVDRARQTASNAEFSDLILQYLVHVAQGGHAYLAFDAHFNPTISLVSDIPRDAFSKMPLWGNLINGLAWNAHANLDLVYREGKYVLNQAAQVEGINLPDGAVVEKVDGLSTDDFVLLQQYRTHLRYDPQAKKFFIYPLLTVDPGFGQPGWEVTFRLPAGEMETVFVKKIPGYVTHRPDESHVDNIRCLALDEAVLYIKIQTFSYEQAAHDRTALQQCFVNGGFQKVIFDVRGNNGGEIWSYMDNILAPLAREPLTYESTAAVKESFYQWYGWRFWLFQTTTSNELSDAPTHIVNVEEISYPPYSDQGWRVMRITRKVEPAAEPFPFEGQAYVLTDNNTLSAGDSFARTMQSTGLAKIVGANTVGWGQAYQAKMLYGLPNSGILFWMDAELTFNPDGSLNNYIGVIPDVVLNASSYPTAYPVYISRDVLLSDPWVQWVLEDSSQ